MADISHLAASSWPARLHVRRAARGCSWGSDHRPTIGQQRIVNGSLFSARLQDCLLLQCDSSGSSAVATPLSEKKKKPGHVPSGAKGPNHDQEILRLATCNAICSCSAGSFISLLGSPGTSSVVLCRSSTYIQPSTSSMEDSRVLQVFFISDTSSWSRTQTGWTWTWLRNLLMVALFAAACGT